MDFDMNILSNIIKFSSADSLYNTLKAYPRLIDSSLDLNIITKIPSHTVKGASLYIRFNSNDVGFLERCIKISKKLFIQSAFIQKISWYDGLYKIKFMVVNIDFILYELINFITHRSINKQVYKCCIKMYRNEYLMNVEGMHLFETKDNVYPIVKGCLKLNNNIDKEVKIKMKMIK
jgi:hypothetical protein